MARVIYGEMITAIVGSVGGTTHSKNRYGFHIKNKAIPTNPNSPEQATIRAYMKEIVAFWKSTITAAQAAAFDHAAGLHKRSKYGQSFNLSGFNLFCGVNVLRKMSGQGILDTPGIFDGAPPVIIPAITDEAVTGKKEISAWGNLVGEIMAFVYSTNAVPVSTSYKNAPFVFRSQLYTAVGLPILIDVAYPTTGQTYKIFVGLKVFNYRGAIAEMIYTDYSGTIT